jgi:hypothetical protein
MNSLRDQLTTIVSEAFEASGYDRRYGSFNATAHWSRQKTITPIHARLPKVSANP